MTPTRKKAPTQGRPRKSVADQKDSAKRAKEDGERLNSALRQMGLSQADAASRSGLRQGWISEMVSGKRAIGREDLRRLGKIGIPPDYLLGLTETLTPVGMSIAKADLAVDLAKFLQDELTGRFAPEEVAPNSEPYMWLVANEAALRFAVAGAVAAAQTELEFRRRLPNIEQLQNAISAAANALAGHSGFAAKEAMKQLLEADKHRAVEARSLLSTWAGSQTGVILASRERIERVLKSSDSEAK